MHVIIIGAGPSGITAADVITDLDRTVECTVLTGENLPPYSPPMMYDHFINGFDIFWKGRTFDKFAFYQDTAVTSTDLKHKHVITSRGHKMHFDKLIIASGSSLYAPINGIDKRNVYNFKSLTAASELIERANNSVSSKVVIIGAGLIGVEISLLLNALHIQVILLEKQNQILPSIASPEVSDRLKNILKLHGIEVILNTEVTEFKGEDIASEVICGNGKSLQADFFVAATGSLPQIGFLDKSDIQIKRGVCIDRYLRTSVDSVFAIGDCTENADDHKSYGILNNTFFNAIEQAMTCAYNVLGGNLKCDVSCRINSVKHIKVPLIIAGSMTEQKHVYSRNNELRIIYTENNRIRGFQLFNSERGAGILASLMRSSRDISSLSPYLTSPHLNHSFVY